MSDIVLPGRVKLGFSPESFASCMVLEKRRLAEVVVRRRL